MAETGSARRHTTTRALEHLGPSVGAIVAFSLIAIAGSLFSPTFLTQRNATNVLRQSAMLGVVSVGMTFVILTAGIDLSVGMVLSLTSVVAALLFDNGQGLPLAVVFLATLALGALVGCLQRLHDHLAWRRALHCDLGDDGDRQRRRPDGLGRQTDRRHPGNPGGSTTSDLVVETCALPGPFQGGWRDSNDFLRDLEAGAVLSSQERIGLVVSHEPLALRIKLKFAVETECNVGDMGQCR